MNTRAWESWFIVGLYKEISSLFSLFLKMLETFSSTFFKLLMSGGKTSKKLPFIPVKALFQLLSSKTIRVLLPRQHPLCRRAFMHSKKTKTFKKNLKNKINKI